MLLRLLPKGGRLLHSCRLLSSENDHLPSSSTSSQAPTRRRPEQPALEKHEVEEMRKDAVTAELESRELGKRMEAKRTRMLKERQEASKEDDEEYEGQRKEGRAIIRMADFFRGIPDDEKNAKTFANAVGTYLIDNSNRRGHIEFIYAALSMMKEFGVERDLIAYKQLWNLFPKGKMIPTTKTATDYLHYPRDQECAVKLLDTMEMNGVMIDKEFFDMVKNVFGTLNETAQKVQRMAYWQTKFKNLSPFPTPRKLPADGLALAQLAVKYMCRDPANVVKTYAMKGSPNSPYSGWIVSGYSCHQVDLINRHDATKPLYVDGPSRVWVRYAPVNYFVLMADPVLSDWRIFEKDQHETEEDESPEESGQIEAWRRWSHNYNSAWSERRRELLARGSIHEQRDETIFAIAATAHSTKDSAAAWVNQLTKEIPRLKDLSIVFRLRHIGAELASTEKETAVSSPPTI